MTAGSSIRDLAWRTHPITHDAQSEMAHSHVPPTSVAVPQKVWTISRIFALLFMIVSAALAGFALREGFAARDTGLLCALSAVAAATVLYGVPSAKTAIRALMACATAFFVCLSALILLPAFNLWPSGAGPLLFSMIFAIVGTVTRSRLCLAAALVALFGLMVDSDGLTRMRLDAQVAVLGLFSIGLFGGVVSHSRLIASVSMIAVMAATFTLLTSFGVPGVSALAVLSLFALASALGLRGFLQQGYQTAEFPMWLSALMFASAAILFQLHMIGEIGFGLTAMSASQSQTLLLILIGFQAIILFVSLVGWFSGRTSLMDTILLQAVLGLFSVIILDPSRLARLDMGEPTHMFAGMIGVIVALLSAVTLQRAWKNGRPLIAALSAMALMSEAVIGLRLLSADFDIALASLICAGGALSIAALMVLNPRLPTQAAQA